jgi:flagellar hook-associated protein 2
MASIDGLISGLNTTTIISQLMAIERLPKAQLTKQQTASQTMVSTLQALNTLITTMQTAAKAFVPDTITKTSAWTSATATSSNGALASVATGAGAVPGSATFTVTGVATAGAAVSTGIVGSLTTPVASGPFQLTKGGVTSTITVAAGATLADVVSALNGPGTGVSATAVQVADGAYRLQITSSTTGSASEVTLSSGAFPAGQSSLGDMQQLSAGTDTVLRVGTGPGAFDVTSSTTSVSGLLPGVTITALKADPGASVTVKVASDTGGMADKMASMVAQANAVLSFIDSKSSYDATSKIGGPLVGDSMGRDITARVTATVIGSSTSTPAMSGVSVARDGSITFDRAAFLAAYAKDPVAVTSTMTSMSQQLSDVATQASDPHIGYVTTRITGEQDSIRGYTTQIAAFEDRMTLRQQTLTTQYAALETMLGKLKSQSDWLTGQLASLPTYSSNSK